MWHPRTPTICLPACFGRGLTPQARGLWLSREPGQDAGQTAGLRAALRPLPFSQPLISADRPRRHGGGRPHTHDVAILRLAEDRRAIQVARKSRSSLVVCDCNRSRCPGLRGSAGLCRPALPACGLSRTGHLFAGCYVVASRLALSDGPTCRSTCQHGKRGHHEVIRPPQRHPTPPGRLPCGDRYAAFLTSDGAEEAPPR